MIAALTLLGISAAGLGWIFREPLFAPLFALFAVLAHVGYYAMRDRRRRFEASRR